MKTSEATKYCNQIANSLASFTAEQFAMIFGAHAGLRLYRAYKQFEDSDRHEFIEILSDDQFNRLFDFLKKRVV